MLKGNNVKNCIISMVTILSVGMYLCHIDNMTVSKAMGTGEVKTYIVCTETKSQIKKLEREYDSSVEINANGEEQLKKNKMTSLELEESEADELEKDSSVSFIEEDIIVTASSHSEFDVLKDVDHPWKKYHKKEEKRIKKNKSQNEWNVRMIHADEESGKTKKKKTKKKKIKKVKVAVLDSGVDYGNDIDVADTITLVPGEEELSPLFMDGTGHGDCVAGLIAAKDNKEGITGINPNVEIYSIRVLDDNNQAPVSRVVEGIYMAIDEGVNIINMSFGVSQYSEALEKAVQDAEEAGILIVAAAGNTGEKGVQYPAAFDEVIAVGSVDKTGDVADSSAVGEQLELVAPGEMVRSTGFLGEEIVSSGTSLAAPQVTAVASLIWQRDLDMPAEFVRGLLRDSANAYGEKNENGYGLVDAGYALENYSTYKKQYLENEGVMGNREPVIEENQKKVLCFDETGCVEGSWVAKDHATLVASSNSYVQKGARFNDTKKDKYCSNVNNKENTYYFGSMELNPWWHGYYKRKRVTNEGCNYVAAYIFETQMANSQTGGQEPQNMAGLQATFIKKIKSEINKIDWEREIGNKKAENKRSFLWGMAIHNLTDAFSHSIYVDGKYVKHNGDTTKDSDPHRKTDDTKAGKERWTDARGAADAALKKYKDSKHPAGSYDEFSAAKDAKDYKMANIYQYILRVSNYKAAQDYQNCNKSVSVASAK